MVPNTSVYPSFSPSSLPSLHLNLYRSASLATRTSSNRRCVPCRTQAHKFGSSPLLRMRLANPTDLLFGRDVTRHAREGKDVSRAHASRPTTLRVASHRHPARFHHARPKIRQIIAVTTVAVVLLPLFLNSAKAAKSAPLRLLTIIPSVCFPLCSSTQPLQPPPHPFSKNTYRSSDPACSSQTSRLQGESYFSLLSLCGSATSSVSCQILSPFLRAVSPKQTAVWVCWGLGCGKDGCQMRHPSRRWD